MNQDQEKIDGVRHSLAHLLADTVKQMFPGSLNAIGPVIENGFYQDFEIKGKLSEEDLPKIEDAMRAKLNAWKGFSKKEVSLDGAKQVFGDNKYKIELAEEFAAGGKTLTIYTIGGFDDLCKGGHADDLSLIDPNSFKLTSTAGAYWRGDEKNIMLTRIYGVAFETKDELGAYLKQQELAKERDHRKLGKELDLFFISEEVGSGLPLMMPRGEIVKNLLMRYMRQEEEKRGYKYVATPVLTQEKLYQQSGHASYYLEDMYSTETDEEGNKFFIKPMNCPHHHMVFNQIKPSYKQLPLRLSEHAGLYRYELSGTLTGLIRMRGPITQNDSHIYVAKDQVGEEFRNLMLFFEETYKLFGIEDYWYRVSLPDFSKDKFNGDEQLWRDAADEIVKQLDSIGAKYVKEEGEAAFYGPKLDIQTRNVNGKEDSIATVQIDVLVPGRMGLKFVAKDGSIQTPIVIHKSIMGAFERFMGFLIEKTGGHFPFWLAPEQIRIVTVNDSVNDYVAKVKDILSSVVLMKPLKYNEMRFEEDVRKENLGKKIRAAEEMKIPLILIVGPKDMEAETVSLRFRAGDETVEEKIKLSELAEWITKFNG
jgi:threonyl-tRNA synthetase